MRRSASSHVIVLAVLLGLLGAACVRRNESGVAIDTLETKVVFGVDIDDEQAPTPAEAAIPPFDLPLPPGSFDFGDDGVTSPPIPPNLGPCPPASPLSVPKEITEPFVTGNPRVGLYDWRGKKVVIDDAGEAHDVEIPEHTRVLRRFDEVSPEKYTFETVQPLFDGTFLVSRMHVRKTSQSVTLPPEAGPVTGVVQPPRAGEPDGGLALLSTEVVDAAGEPVPGVQSFEPTTPVLLLPLPVASGQAFQSVGVDPRSGQTMVVSGAVRFRERIDACGELIDGWLVELNERIISAGGQRELIVQYVVATQYGGMIVDEVVLDTATQESAHYTLAGVSPNPLPKNLV